MVDVIWHQISQNDMVLRDQIAGEVSARVPVLDQTWSCHGRLPLASASEGKDATGHADGAKFTRSSPSNCSEPQQPAHYFSTDS